MSGGTIGIRLPDEVWDWIDGQDWYYSDWERRKYKNGLPKATKCARALEVIYHISTLEAETSRDGMAVTVTFNTHGAAMRFRGIIEKLHRRK